MKGNSKGIKCKACKRELDASPSDRTHSSLVCNNTKCEEWARPQGSIEQDNRAFFDHSVLSNKGYYARVKAVEDGMKQEYYGKNKEG